MATISVEERYQFMSERESVIMKDWAAGSRGQIQERELVILKEGDQYRGEFRDVTYSPAWWKIIDEPIVNALDHLIRQLGSNNEVSEIRVSFGQDGRVEVFNNGEGIEIEIHKVASENLGQPTYVPTFIFGKLFQGSNTRRPADSIIGGTNGLGAKLSNCFSTEFIVETARGNKKFTQRWYDRMEHCDDPLITNYRGRSYTKLSFAPDYVGLFGYKAFTREIHAELEPLIRARVFFAAVYAASSASKKFKMYFNDELIPVKSMRDIARIVFGEDAAVAHTTIAPPKRYPWEVVAVYSDQPGHLSNVNGVMVRAGKHFKHILQEITAGVAAEIARELKDKNRKITQAQVSGHLFLLLNTKIPGAGWTGQRKDELDIDIKRLADYKLPHSFITQVTGMLKDTIMGRLYDAATKTKKKKKHNYDKYTAAAKAGTKESQKCILVPVEGDSAMTQVSVGVAENFGFEYIGVFSLGGVIMNVRKQCKVVDTPKGKMFQLSEKLKNNVRLNALFDIVGLNPAYRYDPKSPTYDREIRELNYGCIAVCVDQDLDGMGNILGLLLSMFEYMWPNLLERGFVKWFRTPIIRAYPRGGGNVLSFYNMDEYNRWAATKDVSRYNIQYYKGLGTHSRDETISMFKDFYKNLFTYTLDAKSHELFEVYFGEEPDLRKRELSRPIDERDPLIESEQQRTKKISCSYHLTRETSAYQRDNLERKLDHVIDGQNQAGRKILDGLMKALGDGRRMKVAQLAGFISEHENYHHGEGSLADSITGKGFVTTGGKQLPFIVPLSQFGSRKGGGDDAASPRYIWAKLNRRITDLLFPEADYWLLPFNVDEGKRGEPKYFVPILPLAVLESAELPAHGWKLKVWARDVFAVIANVRKLINYGEDIPLPNTPPAKYTGAPYEWKGTFKYARGELYSVGSYKVDEGASMLYITELPLRVWTNNYVKWLLEKKESAEHIIADIMDASNDIRVDIRVKLKPGALGILEDLGNPFFDGVEEFFQLRSRMDSHINLMGMNGEVIEFKNYEDVIRYWFPVRKEYYAKRLERQKVVLELKIKMMNNIIRYVTESNNLKLSGCSAAVQQKLLETNKFDKIYAAKLEKPKFTKTSELENIILKGPKANYDYLLNLSDSRKTNESLEVYRKKLAAFENELEEVSAAQSDPRFPGANIFERELGQLEDEIRRGMETFWLYEEAGKYSL